MRTQGSGTYNSANNPNVGLSDALNKGTDSVAMYPGGSVYTQLAASGQLATASGQLRGVFVSAASATPTIKIWDNTAPSGTILIDTFTPVAGTFYEFKEAKFSTGAYATLSGTVSATFFTGPMVNSL